LKSDASSSSTVSSVTASTFQIQTPPNDLKITPQTTGSIDTKLHSTQPIPFNTKVLPDHPEGLIPTTSSGDIISSTTQSKRQMAATNVFQAIAGNGPPAQITKRTTHPVARLGIQDAATKPIGTNKFYANLFLGTQTQSVWTHPYSLQWAHGIGNASSWGLSISHVTRDQLAYGPAQAPSNAPQYFINPVGIQSIILSASELGTSTALTTSNLGPFSANLNLAANAGAAPLITFPLVQGMAFVTAQYKKATPLIQSSVFFRTFSGPVTVGSSSKWKAVLEDGRTWLMYVTANSGSSIPAFTLKNNSAVTASASFSGTIQIARMPTNAAETVYDQSASSYATGITISGTASGATGSYTFTWTKTGSKPLLMYALPHHVASFNSATAGAVTSVKLMTTTKGMATAVLANSWTMAESNLPVGMDFAPWTPTLGSVKSLSSAAVSAIQAAANSELAQDFNAQTNLESMYFSGKGLAKFAQIVWVTSELADDKTLAAAGLAKLKTAFKVFIDNKQEYPLVYDDVWKGVVSSGGYTDPNVDFGNTNYNDHHFHYGYHVYTAAVIARLDPTWLTKGTNKAWVNTLCKDFNNPSTSGTYYPFSRSFDWFHGHSWAKGLFESADGKDEESSSEDAFASFAIKMWGQVTGDASMEARGNLMLAIQARSLPSYFLLDSGNTVQPSAFIPQKVTGILFENKVDHATYFGMNPEYIQGIHMIPLGPHSTFTRSKKLVNEEWNTYFASTIDTIVDGWRGILWANRAITNPKQAFNFFNQTNFDNSWLDGGASMTWYLAWCAGLGGA